MSNIEPMKSLSRIVFSALTILILSLLISCQNEEDAWITDLEDAVFTEINAVRSENGVSALSLNQDLADFARAHSRDMALRGYFSHTTPDGKSFEDRINESGISYTLRGENIYMQWGDNFDESVDDLAVTVVDVWFNSEGHKEIMLKKDFNRGGVGCYQGDSALYVTFTVIQQ
jgi:uncharacterized protein YkwD